MRIVDKIQSFILSPNIIWSALIFLGAIVLWTFIRRFGLKLIYDNRITGKKANNFRMVLGILKYVIFLITGMIILEINGVDVSALVTSIGIAGVVIGFALQDMLKDIIMGANILMDDYFAVGDIVKFREIEFGEIASFNLKATRILDHDTGNTVIVSNRSISEITKISNWQIIAVPAPYTESAERMREVCLMICEQAEKDSMVKACEFLGTGEFEDSHIKYLLKVTGEPHDRLAVKRVILGIIQDVYKKEKIEIPFAQLDVHLDK